MTNTTNNLWLPSDCEIPKPSSRYLKFTDGDTKFRILSSPVIGWEYWVKGAEKPTPVRIKGNKRPNIDLSKVEENKYGQKNIRYFWAMVVWDYADSTVKILSITQRSVIEGIKALAEAEEWGNPLGYDIKVTRKKEGDLVKYIVTPGKRSDIPDEVVVALAQTGPNMDAWLAGKDPFGEPNEKVPF